MRKESRKINMSALIRLEDVVQHKKKDKYKESETLGEKIKYKSS